MSGRAAQAAAPIGRGSLDSYRSRYEKRLTVPAPAPMLTPSVVLLVSAPAMMVLIAPLGSCITAIPTVTTKPVFVPATPFAVGTNDPVLKSNWYSQLSPPTEHEAPPVAAMGTFVVTISVPITSSGSMLTRSPGLAFAGLKSRTQPSLAFQSTAFVVTVRVVGLSALRVWVTRVAPVRRLVP